MKYVHANLSIQYRCQLFNKYLKRNLVGLLSTSFNSLVVIPLARNNKQLSHLDSDEDQLFLRSN
jgi:hypothetical protein